jgi:hypothetical protein
MYTVGAKSIAGSVFPSKILILKFFLEDNYGLNKPTIFQAGLWGRNLKLFYGLSSPGLEIMLLWRNKYSQRNKYSWRNKYSRFYLNFKFKPLKK